jgi:ribonuclease BN (tRNA processing enzyme)
MKLVFLGIGEAFDKNLPNNSVLVSSKTNLLLDCGYSVPQQLWKYNNNPDFLDAIFISHRHADHYFGLPPLFTNMYAQNRKKPLTIICEKGLKKIILELLEYGYQGFPEKYEFNINFIEVSSGQEINFNEFVLSFASTTHSASNLAIKVSCNNKSFCYSGDGMFNQETEALYKNSDLVIHEAYLYDEKIDGHARITDLLDMAVKNNIKCLALTHLNEDFRKKELANVKKEVFNTDIKVIIPEPLETFEFED